MPNRTDRTEKANQTSTPETATAARQGLRGRPVLIVLVIGMLLAMLIWLPVEWWGASQAPEPDNAVNQAYPDSGSTADQPAANN